MKQPPLEDIGHQLARSAVPATPASCMHAWLHRETQETHLEHQSLVIGLDIVPVSDVCSFRAGAHTRICCACGRCTLEGSLQTAQQTWMGCIGLELGWHQVCYSAHLGCTVLLPETTIPLPLQARRIDIHSPSCNGYGAHILCGMMCSKWRVIRPLHGHLGYHLGYHSCCMQL